MFFDSPFVGAAGAAAPFASAVILDEFLLVETEAVCRVEWISLASTY